MKKILVLFILINLVACSNTKTTIQNDEITNIVSAS